MPSHDHQREFLDPTVLAGLAGLPLMARRPMRGTVSGMHVSPNRGASVEFAEYRKYVPGDDLRRLDWRAHGRSDRYYVKEFEADTNLRCGLVLDTSGSMDFGSGEITKLQYARKLVAAIAYLAVQQGDAVGLSCVAEGIGEHLPTRRNPAHLRLLFDMLEKTKCQGETHLVDVLHEVAETTSQGAMVIVVSDFFVDPDLLRGCFEHLRFRKHDLSLFHLLDPLELDFTFQRPTRFLDMEGGTSVFAEPSEIADRYQLALREYLENIQAIVLETGVDYHRVSIDERYQDVLTTFLTRRRDGEESSMSFLQPWMLFALPLAALPIIIHLINQRRYQTTRWAAMMFLLAANRMNRGYARIRQWAILALRTMVIAALVFAVGRPLSSGLLGSAISGAGATNPIVLLDRSPSMQERATAASLTKLESGVANLADTLETMRAGRVVLIESNSVVPRELESPASLLDLPQAGPSDASADLPAMMLAALDYIRANELGQCEIWICSDLREHDWRVNDGRWASIRESFAEFGRRVRFRLLAFAENSSNNRGIRVVDARLVASDNDSVVSISIKLAGDEPARVGVTEPIPVTVEIEGARSTAEVNFDGSAGELRGHRIALPRGQTRGWGRVSIPADTKAADNDFYFTFDVVPPRRTIIVSSNDDVARVLQLAAEITPEEDIQSVVEVVAPGAVESIDWQSASLVLWQDELQEKGSKLLKSFVDRGGNLIFLPPDHVSSDDSGDSSFGIRWGKWIEAADAVNVASWRGDADLLSATLAGTALPVGSLRVNRFAEITGEVTPLATLTGGSLLLGRVPTPRGGVYALATTPRNADSSLATDGVVLYVMIQRALEAGSRALLATGQLDAGASDVNAASNWQQLAGYDDRLSTERNFNAGVYANKDQWLAINRSSGEDRVSTLTDIQFDALFRNLLVDRVNQQADSNRSLVAEVWRAFLIIMLIAMIGEACLCLPRRPTEVVSSTSKGLAT